MSQEEEKEEEKQEAEGSNDESLWMQARVQMQTIMPSPEVEWMRAMETVVERLASLANARLADQATNCPMYCAVLYRTSLVGPL